MEYPEYIPPILTIDSVVMQLIDGELFVLLIKRDRAPFKDAYALPGGYNPAGETTQQAMSRILKSKAGIDAEELKLVEQLYTFDTVARDPRGHAVSVSYLGLGKDIVPEGSTTTQSPQFFSIKKLPELAYDHSKIIQYALERFASKVTYTNAIFAILPPLFTLSQLQKAYEAVLDRSLDKRNFRKKFLSLNLVKETNEVQMQGAHRPAKLYKFNKQSLEALSRSLD